MLTGPTTDHTFGTKDGYYLYVEASLVTVYSSARIVTPVVSNSGSACTSLDFWWVYFNPCLVNTAGTSDAWSCNPGNLGSLSATVRSEIPVNADNVVLKYTSKYSTWKCSARLSINRLNKYTLANNTRWAILYSRLVTIWFTTGHVEEWLKTSYPVCLLYRAIIGKSIIGLDFRWSILIIIVNKHKLKSSSL